MTWLTNTTAFLSWLKLSVYMAIVSVAIVMSFHLKSEPTPLGKSIAKPLHIMLTTLYRKAFRVATRNRLLASFDSVHVVWVVELHQHGLPVQHAAGARADRLEDAGRVHRGVKRDCCDVHIVSLYKCREVDRV